jgi:hypothetical protein
VVNNYKSKGAAGARLPASEAIQWRLLGAGSHEDLYVVEFTIADMTGREAISIVERRR